MDGENALPHLGRKQIYCAAGALPQCQQKNSWAQQKTEHGLTSAQYTGVTLQEERYAALNMKRATIHILSFNYKLE